MKKAYNKAVKLADILSKELKKRYPEATFGEVWYCEDELYWMMTVTTEKRGDWDVYITP